MKFSAEEEPIDSIKDAAVHWMEFDLEYALTVRPTCISCL